MLTPKTINNFKEFTNPCDQFEDFWVDQLEEWVEDEWERTSLEAIYNKTKGPNWTNNDGWLNETVSHCQWYGISCK